MQKHEPVQRSPEKGERVPSDEFSSAATAAVDTRSGKVPAGPSRLTVVKDVVQTVQAAAGTVALVAAAVWFALQGQHRARLNVKNELTHRTISDGVQRVAIDIVIANVGSVKADISCINVYVYQVLPDVGDNVLLSNPKMDTCSETVHLGLEPAEQYPVHTERMISGDVHTISVKTVTYLDVRPGHQLGYERTTLYDLVEPSRPAR